MGERLVEQIFTALDEQTVTVPGTAAAEKIPPKLADSLREVLRQRDELAAEVEGMLDAHPPPSRAYYERKRAQGKRHNAALICPSRRRVDVLFAMLRDRRPYQTRPTNHALAA